MDFAVTKRLVSDTTRKAPTLRDVAQQAGVSPYTVSAVLNGARSNTRVSESTRQRILDSAAQLGYYPNAMARGLAKQRTQTIGVVVGIVKSEVALSNRYVSAVLHGIVQEAAHSGYAVLLYTEPWVDAPYSVPRFRQWQADGIILIAPLSDTDMLSGLAETGIPLSVVSPDPDSCPPTVASVDVDNARGIEIAVDHLARLGHRRIAHLMGDANVASVAIRREAFRAAMTKRGLPFPDGYLVPCNYHGDLVLERLPGLMGRPDPPTALVAGNDNMAVVALQAARTLGIAVPDELSVVGFDDIPVAEQVLPPLTTIRQPLDKIGNAAARLLIARIEQKQNAEEKPAERILVAPDLVVRGSTRKL